MNLTVRRAKDILESYAPSYLKESYDNVGLMIGDLDAEVNSILVALDCTLEIIDEAIEKKCNLIITHHPLLFSKPASITTDTLLGTKIIKLIRNNINVYSSHTNLDKVRGGLNDIITELLGFKDWQIIDVSADNINHKNEGVGRLVNLDEPYTVQELCENIKTLLNVSQVRYSGEQSKLVSKIAIINGSGEDFFELSVKNGADCIITGDTTYHYISDYNEMGVVIIDVGHFETEWPAMKVAANIFSDQIKKIGYNVPVFVSEKSTSPYKFI